MLLAHGVVTKDSLFWFRAKLFFEGFGGIEVRLPVKLLLTFDLAIRVIVKDFAVAQNSGISLSR